MTKTIVLTLALLAPLAGLHAQEVLPRADAVKFAALANFDLEKLADTPIPTDADVKRPFGVKAEKRGGLVVPEAKLSAATLAGLGKDVQPIGQLWLAGLVPVRNGQPVARDELKLISLEYEGREVTVLLCVLGARRTAGDKLELLVYGNSKQPLITAPLVKSSKPQNWPLEFDAERDGDGARVKLFLVGNYEAALAMTASAD